ncbi:MAG: DNA alkylation repair protein [Succinivibrio sp.]
MIRRNCADVQQSENSQISVDSVILNELFALQDIKYRDFTSRLTPGISFIGVRLPALKKLSKTLLKKYGCDAIIKNISENMYYEELYIKGYSIACGNMPVNERFEKIQRFISCIRGWSNCDGFCCLLKECSSYKDEYYSFLQMVYQNSCSPYQTRFVLVMILIYFAFEDKTDEIIELVEKTDCSHYYVSMAAAWLLATLYCRCSDVSKEKILRVNTDRLTYNRTISKIIESRIPAKEEKEYVKTLRKKS